MKRVYPVIFTQTIDAVLVEVPDMKMFTEGKDIADAIEMARDVMGLCGITLEDVLAEIPHASKIEEIEVESATFAKDGKSFVTLVDIDFVEYRRKIDNKAVRRNVTLPNWLNQEAEKSHLNVSKVLQEALMAKLNIVK